MPAARRYARLAGTRFRAIRWPPGTAPELAEPQLPGDELVRRRARGRATHAGRRESPRTRRARTARFEHLDPGVLGQGDASPPDRALNIGRTAVTSPFVKLRLLALIALASALTLSFTVSPAGAGLGGRVVKWTDCAVFASEFSAYARLLESVQAGGGSKVRREPELGRATEIGPQQGRGERLLGGRPDLVPHRPRRQRLGQRRQQGGLASAVRPERDVRRVRARRNQAPDSSSRWRGSRARRTRPGTTPAPGPPTSEP